MGSRWGLSLQSSVPWVGQSWVGPPPAAPHGFVSILSPAETLKSKQDELHRKALETLER